MTNPDSSSSKESDYKRSFRASPSQCSLSPEQLSYLVHQFSHDIGNPLTSIISYSSILEQSAQFSLPLDKVADYAKSISRETWRISVLMEKFLLLSSISMNATPVPLSEIQQRVFSRYRSRYNLTDIDITFEGFDSEDFVLAEAEHLTAIMCEIASNALGAQKALKNSSLNEAGSKYNDEIEDNFMITFKCSSQSSSISDDKPLGQFILIEAYNPTAPHTLGLDQLFEVGQKCHPSGRDNLGIGLPAILHSISRWGGEVEIEEEQKSGETYFRTKLYLQRAN